jgi:hypothetical protein
VVPASAVKTKKRSLLMAKSYEKGEYTDAKDKKKDAEMTKGMSPKEKAEFKKKDKAHKKPKTMAEDKKKDAKIIKDIKAKKK